MSKKTPEQRRNALKKRLKKAVVLYPPFDYSMAVIR